MLIFLFGWNAVHLMPLECAFTRWFDAVHYVAKLAGSGEVFMDTRAESATGDPIQVVAGRGNGLAL